MTTLSVSTSWFWEIVVMQLEHSSKLRSNWGWLHWALSISPSSRSSSIHAESSSFRSVERQTFFLFFAPFCNLGFCLRRIVKSLFVVGTLVSSPLTHFLWSVCLEVDIRDLIKEKKGAKKRSHVIRPFILRLQCAFCKNCEANRLVFRENSKRTPYFERYMIYIHAHGFIAVNHLFNVQIKVFNFRLELNNAKDLSGVLPTVIIWKKNDPRVLF